MPPLRFLTLLSACLLFTGAGCGSTAHSLTGTHRPYRMNVEQSDQEDSAVTHLAPASGATKRATLSHLEFDDQGEPWRGPNPEEGWTSGSSTQLPALLKELKALTDKGPVRVFIYIHGWNDNAGEGGSLPNFRRSLQELASASDYPVFGVHIGWRGKVAPFPIFVDVGSREAAAERIGRSSLLAALRAISAAARRQEKSRVLAIGHSFGAKILCQITCDVLSGQIGDNLGASRGLVTENFQPVVDTIILTNTAENASQPLQLVNLMRDYRVTYKNKSNGRDIPLMVSITSTGDWATGGLLPLWNRFARDVIGLPGKGGAVSSDMQHVALFPAMGFYGPLRSHTLMRDGQPAREGAIKWVNDHSWRDMINENVKRGRLVPDADGSTRLYLRLTPDGNVDSRRDYTVNYLTDGAFAGKRPKGWARNATPFWFLQVPPFVSKNHGDMWNANFTALVTAIEAMSRPPVGSAASGKQSSLKIQNAPN